MIIISEQTVESTGMSPSVSDFVLSRRLAEVGTHVWECFMSGLVWLWPQRSPGHLGEWFNKIRLHLLQGSGAPWCASKVGRRHGEQMLAHLWTVAS